MSIHESETTRLGHKPARYSIDLSLDLEHRLNSLSNDDETPASPTVPTAASLDPEILASIIVGLRASLSQAHQERDDLTASLELAHSRTAHLEARAADLLEQLEMEREKSTSLTEKLTVAEKAAQENEEQVVLLRAKVEESRRGVMRIQAESRRMSGQFSGGTQPLTLDLSRPPPSAFASNFTVPLSAKRTSFAPPPSPGLRPLHAHRRNTSLSDPALPKVDHDGQDIRNSNSARRPNGFAEGHDTPPRASFASSRSTSDNNSLYPSSAEVESLQAELSLVRAKLIEAQDARQASEECLRALREFMAEQNNPQPSHGSQGPNLKGLSLPPLPTDNIPDEEEVQEPKASGWGGLRLWRQGSVSKPSLSSKRSSRSPPLASQPETTHGSSLARTTTNSSTSDKESVRSGGSSFKKFGFFGSNPSPPADANPSLGLPGDRSSMMSGSLSSGSSGSGSGSSGPHSPVDEHANMVQLSLSDDDTHLPRKHVDVGEITPRLVHGFST